MDPAVCGCDPSRQLAPGMGRRKGTQRRQRNTSLQLYRKMAHCQDCVECVPIPFMDIKSWGYGAGDCLIVTFADLETQPLKTGGSSASYSPRKKQSCWLKAHRGLYLFKRQVVGISVKKLLVKSIF